MLSNNLSIFRILPWLAVVVMGCFIYFKWPSEKPEPPKLVITSNTLLQSVETLGKLELVKYNFQKITEVKQDGKEYWKMVKVDTDSKIVLISQGEAVACVDLTKIQEQDITIAGDSVVVVVPAPELCYFKLDLDKTRIYSLETGFFVDKKEFIQQAYKVAEKEIRDDALNSGIFQNAIIMSGKMLKPILEKISGKKLIIQQATPLPAPKNLHPK